MTYFNSKRQIWTAIIAIAIFVIIGGRLSKMRSQPNKPSITVTRELRVPYSELTRPNIKYQPIDVLGIRAAADNGAFIFGDIGSQWIRKYDQNGVVQWNYWSPVLTDPQYPMNPGGFEDVIELSNGKILACGTREHSTGPMLSLTMLAPDGQLLWDREYPNEESDEKPRRSIQGHRCFVNGESLVIYATFFSRPSGRVLLSFDLSGNLISRADLAYGAAQIYQVRPDEFAIKSFRNGIRLIDLKGNELSGVEEKLSGQVLLTPVEPLAFVYAATTDGRDLINGISRFDPRSKTSTFQSNECGIVLTVDSGAGFVRSDGSAVFFGPIEGGIYPTVAVLDSKGRVTEEVHFKIPALTVNGTSFWDSSRYVTVMTADALYLKWISII